jgi:energy-converting hydrogenase Eha subunit G
VMSWCFSLLSFNLFFIRGKNWLTCVSSGVKTG